MTFSIDTSVFMRPFPSVNGGNVSIFSCFIDMFLEYVDGVNIYVRHVDNLTLYRHSLHQLTLK